jgi:cytoskeleton protein RodZ
MNDPGAVEPRPARADDSGRATPAGFGYALAQARVRAGLTVEQAAARIRLNPRQLQAIENEDLHSLPAAAYVNGFVRNYARELGMDAGPLIEDLNAKLTLRGLTAQEPDLAPGGTVRAPLLDDRAWRHLVLAAIVIGLICAGLVGLWMARSAYRSAGGPATSQPTRSEAAPAEAPAAAGQALAPAAVPEAPVEAGARVQPPVAATAVPAAPSGPDAEPALAAGAAAPAAQPVVAVGAPAAPPTAAVAAPAAGPVDADSKSAGGAGAHTALAALPPAAPATGLLLRFNERSWVEVSRPDGRVLLSRIGEPGSVELVNASPPLVLVVGRADAVKVEYRGQPVNLKPYVNTTNGVARVLLADSDAASGGQGNR